MRWTQEQVVEHLTPPPGITMPPYPKERDRLYRWTLAALALGLTGEGAGQAAAWPHAGLIAQGWIAASVVAASFSFLVWLTSWRMAVRALAIAGFVLWPWWHLGGWAASLGAASIMAAKETHCFHFPAGRVLPWYSLALGIALAAGVHGRLFGLAWLALAGLWWWLAADRSRLPLFEI